jgi:AAA domain
MAKLQKYPTLKKLVERLRDDLNGGNQDFVLLFAYNGTGKTRLSMEFKESGKKSEAERDTLYFNAFTEDLFVWDNDFEEDINRVLKINSESRFFAGFRELELETKIFTYLQRYAKFNFKIDYDNWTVSFYLSDQGNVIDNIKISRGEQNIFVWCVFLAIVQLALDEAGAYSWVDYIYIDDPISSLDDNNAIAIASDLVKLIGRERRVDYQEISKRHIKAIISSHHVLFFNVLCNEMKHQKFRRYFLHKPDTNGFYVIQSTENTPFFHHVAMLSELHKAANSVDGKVHTYHFNVLRGILEKTAVFFGFDHFSKCVHGIEDNTLYERALQLLSHGGYSIYEPTEMGEDTKKLFKDVLNAFLEKYKFDLPELTPAAADATTPIPTQAETTPT